MYVHIPGHSFSNVVHRRPASWYDEILLVGLAKPCLPPFRILVLGLGPDLTATAVVGLTNKLDTTQTQGSRAQPPRTFRWSPSAHFLKSSMRFALLSLAILAL